MLVSDEFWNTIEGIRVHLLYDREGMDGTRWDAKVAVCAAALINDRQQGLQGKRVDRAEGYACSTAETAVRINEEDMVWPLRHGCGRQGCLVKITPTP